MNSYRIIYALLLVVLPLLANATGKASDDRQLTALLSRLGTADGYAYRATVHSEMLGGNQEKETMVMSNYQSRSAYIIYSSTDDMLLFVCTRGQFRVNYKDKQVFYATFPDDPAAARQHLTDRYDGYPADSFLLKDATIVSRKATKTSLVYTLHYPEASMIRNARISCDPKTGAFISIAYTLEQPLTATAAVRKKVVMDQYRKEQPAAVGQLLTAITDLPAYLQRTYKGYKIEKINL